MVPRLLNDDQKEHRLQLCQDIIEHLQNEHDLLNSIIIVDEMRNFEWDQETKRQSSMKKSLTSPAPKKAKKKGAVGSQNHVDHIL